MFNGLVLSALLLVLQAFHAETDSSLLHKGLALEQAAQYEQALQTWASAFTELDTPSLAIGREYIRLTTEQGLRGYYETASSMYLWGLTAGTVEANREALQKELAMLRPLADRHTWRKWMALLEENNPSLNDELYSFWQQLNPTPATRYNERLIEHWERIAYARKHFNRGDDPPYGTDDRGKVYVQYGPPDRERDGNLTVNRGQVYEVCSELGLCDTEIMANVVFDLDPHPYYEIWIYNRPNLEMEYNLVKIFGETSLDGFRQVDVIEDFIPSRAFTLSKRFDSPSPGTGSNSPGEKMTPGMVMQWLYYKQLATTDFIFSSRFGELEFNWVRADKSNPSLGKFQGPLQEQRSQNITRQNLRHAPDEMSTYEKEFPDIPLATFHYRLLDEQNRPVTATFLESRPRQAFLEDFAFNEEVLLPGDTAAVEQALAYYELSHGLLVTGENGQVLNRSAMPAELILDFRDDLSSSTVFTVPYADTSRRLTLYAELHNRHPGSSPRLGQTPFPPELRGLGRLVSELPEPLSTDPATLEMADLVLGWQMRHDTPEGTLFPFVVANHRQIPEGEELAVHLQIYNLQQAGDGFTDFRIDYEVQPVRRMEWLRGREQEFSLTLDQRTTQTRFTENLEIRTRELPPGRYRLRLVTTDNTSGQRVEREIEFRVVERDERETVSVN